MTAAAVVVFVLFAILGFLLYEGPVGFRHAAPGLRYRVGPVDHVIPPLAIVKASPCLIREPVLGAMATLLRYADALLTAEGIPYWISCGTLLGAVRHQGFIPWDDDIDVQVLMVDRARLMALDARLRQDGYVLVEAAGGFKLACGNFWRFPYIDVAIVDGQDGALKLCYPLGADGRGTFEKALQWPNECLPVDCIFPLARVRFEDFSVSAPGQTEAAVKTMYGPRSLVEVRHPGHFFPWIVNHRTDSLLLKMRLIKG